tara:strand:- start:73 stop:222 length:150 start_codon:yes stop_codon:yes gene_type:complete
VQQQKKSRSPGVYYACFAKNLQLLWGVFKSHLSVCESIFDYPNQKRAFF